MTRIFTSERHIQLRVPGEIKRMEVELDPQVSPDEIMSREVELDPQLRRDHEQGGVPPQGRVS